MQAGEDVPALDVVEGCLVGLGGDVGRWRRADARNPMGALRAPLGLHHRSARAKLPPSPALRARRCRVRTAASSSALFKAEHTFAPQSLLSQLCRRLELRFPRSEGCLVRSSPSSRGGDHGRLHVLSTRAVCLTADSRSAVSGSHGSDGAMKTVRACGL